MKSDIDDIRTSIDLIRAVAICLQEGEVTTLDELENLVRDWMISEEEESAYVQLIEAARESIENSYEGA